MDRDWGRDCAERCRRAAREAVADVEPARLHDFIDATIDEASMTPSVLVLESATLVDSTVDATDDAIASKAAAVQLVYEGLAITRRLAQESPWDRRQRAPNAQGPTPTDPAPGDDFSEALDPDRTEDIRADLEIVAADILVARGFSILARTSAADKAVATIRAFGRNQTRRRSATNATARETDDASTPIDDATDRERDVERLDAALERDVLELAALTGASVADQDEAPPATLVATTNDLIDAVGTALPPVDEFARWLDARLPEHVPGDGTSGASITSDRATSATDP